MDCYTSAYFPTVVNKLFHVSLPRTFFSLRYHIFHITGWRQWCRCLPYQWHPASSVALHHLSYGVKL